MPAKYILGLLLIGAVLAAFVNPLFILVAAGLLLSVFYLFRNLEFGLIILVFFFPYLGLIVDFSTIDALREIPYVRDINAPFVDLYGMVFLLAWAIRMLVNPKSEIRNPNQSPMIKTQHLSFVSLVSSFFSHWRSYLLFFFSALISLIKVPSYALGVSLKYLARPILFFYLVFFAPTVSIIEQGGKKFLMQVFGAMYLTGLLSALIGVASFFIVPFDGFPRATSFILLGLEVWGPNHNLLAETLIATAPAGILLMQNAELRMKKLIGWGMFFQYAIALLTFSRTAWIAIAVQAALFLILQYRGQVRAFLRRARPALIALIPFVLYLIWSMSTAEVQGSNSTRLDLIRIAWFYFVRDPWIGSGVGTFIPTLWGVKAFMLEYGKALEAHGIVWKLLFEQGILGLITFGIFIGSILLSIYKTYKSNRANRSYNATVVAAFLMAVGILTYELFNTTYYTSKLWIPLGVAVGAASLFLRNNETSTKATKN